MLKNTCEGVHLIVKLPAISFKLFIVLFLGIILWVFQVSLLGGGEGELFSDGGGGLHWGSTPWERIGFDMGGGFEKNHRMGVCVLHMPSSHTMGNPATS